MRMRVAVVVVLLALTACSSSGSKSAPPDDPAAVLQQAAARSLAARAVTFTGRMTSQGRYPLTSFTGDADFAERRVATTVGALGRIAEITPYPPYRMRYIDGLNYIEISPSVHRAPALRADAQWVAYRGRIKGGEPVPAISSPPPLPINILEWARTEPITSASPVHRRDRTPKTTMFAVHFHTKPGLVFTYTIDSHGRIVAVTLTSCNGFDSTFAYTYRAGSEDVVAPTDHVQHVAAGERVYPPSTTVPLPLDPAQRKCDRELASTAT